VYPASVQRSYDTRSAATDVIDGYEAGETVTAYVTPDSPGDAFLRKERSNAPFIAVGIGVITAVLGVRGVIRGRQGS
jgi:cytochrome c peroxidase